MKNLKSASLATALVAVATLSGCASVMNLVAVATLHGCASVRYDGRQRVTIKTIPDGAEVADSSSADSSSKRNALVFSRRL